jgi:hypothetical protein
MPLNPRSEYQISPDVVRLKELFDYSEAYITRPPYQRKTVWPEKRKQSLMDSLLRRYSASLIVLHMRCNALRLLRPMALTIR